MATKPVLSNTLNSQVKKLEERVRELEQNLKFAEGQAFKYQRLYDQEHEQLNGVLLAIQAHTQDHPIKRFKSG